MTHYYAQYDTLQGRYTHEIETAFIKSVFDNVAEDSLILDIGGGGGRIASFLAHRRMRVTVVDISYPPLSYISSELNSAQIYPVMISPDLHCELPFKEDIFDGAVCIQVPDLVENDPSFFGRIAGYLRDGAMLVVTITNRYSFRHMVRVLTGKNMTQAKRKHSWESVVYQFPVGQIIERAQDAGFSLTEWEGYNWPPFPKLSNSGMIPRAAVLERRLHLHRLRSLSPWVIASFRKIEGLRD